MLAIALALHGNFASPHISLHREHQVTDKLNYIMNKLDNGKALITCY